MELTFAILMPLVVSPLSVDVVVVVASKFAVTVWIISGYERFSQPPNNNIILNYCTLAVFIIFSQTSMAILCGSMINE